MPYKEVEKEGLQEDTFLLKVKAVNYLPMEKQLWKSAGYRVRSRGRDLEGWRRAAIPGQFMSYFYTFRNFAFMYEKH